MVHKTTRDLVFVSHANPEDNEFARWLCLQLTKEGYRVWCDLLRLIGGEDIWKDAETAIRNGTAKFLYVLSRISNEKLGPLQELHVAQNTARDLSLHDFVIPLHIDNLPYRQMNIQLGRLDAIPFEHGWARGLSELLKKLATAAVPLDATRAPDKVSALWKERMESAARVVDEEVEHLTNWFAIRRLPTTIRIHSTYGSLNKVARLLESEGIPAFVHRRAIVSFAPPNLLPDKLRNMISGTHDLRVSGSPANPQPGFGTQKSHNIHYYLIRLLRQAWELMLGRRGLPTYALSNRTVCFYFTKDNLGTRKIKFDSVAGIKVRKQLMGFKTMGDRRKRIWHFAISAYPILHPQPAFIIRPHVLFSDDGVTIWDSAARLHAARRSQCKGWWNDDWRDRILASMKWLCNDGTSIVLKSADGDSVEVEPNPITVISPVTYKGPVSVQEVMIDDDLDGDDDVIEASS